MLVKRLCEKKREREGARATEDKKKRTDKEQSENVQP